MAKVTERFKSGRKGGTMYPKVDLERAVEYAKKLISKTNGGEQPKNIILSEVFDSSTWYGEVRLSGTKQYGLVEGNPSGYVASELARKISTASREESPKLLAEACLRPKVFKLLYDKFVNGTISDARIKQQLLNHNVHPDSSDECVALFKNSLVYAGLAKLVDNDILEVQPSPFTYSKSHKSGDVNETLETGKKSGSFADISYYGIENNGFDDAQDLRLKKRYNTKSNVNVNIEVNPSMDPDKLEQYLKLLKNYGAL